MGENEMGSLLRTIIAVLVFAAIVSFFTTVIVIVITLSNNIHNSSYKVN